MIRIFVSICLVLLPCVPASHAAPSDDGAAVENVATPVEEAFVHEAALGALAQLDLGYDALERSRRPDVREFALATLNTMAPTLKELERLASARGIRIPKDLLEYPAYIPERPWEDGVVDFDRAYMEDQVTRYEQTLETFTRLAFDGEDEELRALAWMSLPVLRSRLIRAKAIVARLESAAE